MRCPVKTAWPVAALLLGVLLFATAASGITASQLVVQSLPVEAYPRIDLGITLPAELLASGKTPVFEVTENGEDVELLESKVVTADRDSMDVVLLLDASGSMKGRPLADATTAASRFIGAMGAKDRMAVVSFASSPRVLVGFTSDKTRLVAAVQGVDASGETAVYDALVKSSALIESSTAPRQAVVLLSDGGDTVSVNDANKALAAVKSAAAPVYVVALESDEFNPQVLQLAATRSGGRYLAAKNSGELEAIFAGLAQELGNQYIVSFTSREPNTIDVDIAVTAKAGSASAAGRLTIQNPRYAETGFGTGEPVAIETSKPSAVLLAITALSIFLAVGLLVVAVLRIFAKDKRRLDSLEFYDQTRGQLGEDVTMEPSSGPAGLRRLMMDAVAEVAGKRGFTKSVHQRLERAGLPLRPVEYMTMHISAVVGAGLVTQLLTQNLMVGIMVVVVAVLAPMYYLDRRIRKRREAFEEQLPDMLGLLAGSLRAGWGLLQSIGVVVEQMGPPACDEFRRVQTEARLGLPVESALEKMAERVDSDDFRWTVVAINIQREVGGNLAEVLDIVASTMRARAELRRHIGALTAEGKLSGTILVALPFVVLLALVFANPRYLMVMVANPLGWIIAGVGLLLLVVGVFWLRRAMRVEI